MKLLSASALCAFLLTVFGAHASDSPTHACTFSDIFEQLACERDYTEGRLRVEQLQAERDKLAREAGDSPRVTSFPELARVYGTPDNLTTVWSAGGAEFEARAGDPVADGWIISAVFANGVRLRDTRGAVRTVRIAGLAQPSADLQLEPPPGVPIQPMPGAGR